MVTQRIAVRLRGPRAEASAQRLIASLPLHDPQIVPRGRLHLRPGVAEAAIAGQADDPSVGMGERDAERDRETPTDAREAARRAEAHTGLQRLDVGADPNGRISRIGAHEAV